MCKTSVFSDLWGRSDVSQSGVCDLQRPTIKTLSSGRKTRVSSCVSRKTMWASLHRSAFLSSQVYGFTGTLNLMLKKFNHFVQLFSSHGDTSDVKYLAWMRQIDCVVDNNQSQVWVCLNQSNILLGSWNNKLHPKPLEVINQWNNKQNASHFLQMMIWMVCQDVSEGLCWNQGSFNWAGQSLIHTHFKCFGAGTLGQSLPT